MEPSAIESTGVLIIGSGFAGLAMAAQLCEAGRRDFVILEAADAVGGTWRANHYPGCACDIPSHLYSLSFAPRPDWSRSYAPHDEIRAYLEHAAARWQLHRHLRCGAAVVAATLDEAQARWTITTADGRRFQAPIAVMALGGLSRPTTPHLPGLAQFAGATWHSAAWNHRYDLAGKRVAVVGTGASAIQFVPHVVKAAGQVHLFQRTPPWVLPRRDRAYTDRERWAFRHVPGARALHRATLYLRHELRAIPFTLAPQVLRWVQPLALRHLHAQVADPALRATLTPSYVLGCKRILMSNDYYPALAQPHVEVVTDAITGVTPDGVVTADGRARPVDAIIFGTGFAVHDYLGGIAVTGRAGADLGARWADTPEAYLGTMVDGFPNLFTLIGPNTGLGHNSMLLMIEAQVRLVMSTLAAMARHDHVLVEPRPEAVRAYNDELAARMPKTVWSTGCTSWYRDAAGRNPTLWPGSTVEFAARTWRFDARAYRCEPRPTPATRPTLVRVA
ncbi:MAG: NAD(P)/FAD-dependent oxidoreductase [Kofleriaceae bacterium]